MTQPLTNHDLLQYLKSVNLNAGFLDRIKVYYRPLVCPFLDLIALVQPGDKVGDIGCGSGQFCLLLAQFAKPSSVYGIEISDRLIANARALFDKYSKTPATFEVFDGSVFPEKIAELDIVFLNDVVHHVPKQHQHDFIKNLFARMKPGARLVIKDIDRSSIFSYFNKMHDLIFAGEIGNERTFSEITQWLNSFNAEIIASNKKRMYVYPHYTIVAKKP